MKIKSILFPAAVIALVATFSYYIGGSMRGTNSDQQSIKTPIIETEHLPPPQGNAIGATSREQNAISDSGPDISKKIKEKEIDFESQKQKIEDYYANEFRRLRDNIEIALRKLDAADKTAYARFIEQLNNTTSTSTGYTSVTGRVSPYGNISADGLHIGTTKTHVEGKPASDYELKVRQLDKAANDLISEYRLDFDHLQRRKACALSDLEKEKKRALEAVFNQETTNTAQPVPPKALGTVTGILSSDGAPMTVINGEVIGEGQNINGVKVIKINQDSVEFESAGTHWSQRVNELPSSNWP